MSLTTWKKEFYPVPAKKMPLRKALEHSILKWRGALPGNLRKHGCCLGDCREVLSSRGEFYFSTRHLYCKSNCSLYCS